jgi:hypothetical protein
VKYRTSGLIFLSTVKDVCKLHLLKYSASPPWGTGLIKFDVRDKEGSMRNEKSVR